MVAAFEQLTEAEISILLNLKTDAAYQKELKRYQAGYTSYNRSFVIFQLIKKESGGIIGGCALHSWSEEHRRAELGYEVNEEEDKRKGYMTEAVEAIITYGFNHMNLNRIEAVIAPDNDASMGVIKNFGFVREGFMRQHYFKDGVLYDSLLFALLKEEYKAIPAI